MANDLIRQSRETRAALQRVDALREEIAKGWIVAVIEAGSLDEVERLPLSWATGDLRDLISDILAAAGERGEPRVRAAGIARAKRLAELRRAAPPSQVSRELAFLHGRMLTAIRAELGEEDPELVAELAERLAGVFGLLCGEAMETLVEQGAGSRDPLTSLYRPGQMRERLERLIAIHERYGHPFSIVLLDAEGPGTRDAPQGAGRDTVLAVVGAALRESIRLVDEAFRLEEGALCVLAPNQTTVDAVQMAQRLSRLLAELEAVGGLSITISAGVASCPEHGADPERLLREADTAMWRARAVGQPVGVGELQDR